MPAPQTTAKAAPAAKAPAVTGRAKVAPAAAATPRPIAKPAAPTAAGKSTKPGAQAPPAPVESFPAQQPTYEPRLGLARIASRRLALLKEGTPTGQTPSPTDAEFASQLVNQIQQHYTSAIELAPRLHDAYIELAQILEHEVSLEAAADLYAQFPFVRCQELNKPETSQDDLYIESEITRMFMKLKRYRDPVLVRSMISGRLMKAVATFAESTAAEGREMGIGILAKHMETLDAASEYKTLMEVYAGISRKAVDDPEMIGFFKLKYWL
ncbi:hypothetical protein BDZ88DRAFT_487866 [Geranomyces variabilis]|nr:hypothetical protein BDZ88DRAFT_487866 [Geranomyces variabilis]KAJ3136833.1 hypothetical protein HDU90_002399 [Geranomyces variabilis]